MAAAAFLASLTFAKNNINGEPVTYFCTVSDVNAAFYIFPDGNNFVTLPGGANWILKDISLSAAGTDTRTATIFVNGLNSGRTLLNAANLGTNYSRQFMLGPLQFSGGTNLRFTQNT
jgi:hypothetical protein